MGCIRESDLLAACRVLFGSTGACDSFFLKSLEPREVKSAYRTRALATHPDRFALQGEEHQKICAERFIEATRAYEMLDLYLKEREDEPLFEGNPFQRQARYWADAQCRWRPDRDSGGGSRSRDHEGPFSTAEIRFPNRPLRIGEFLYHSKAISWRTLIKALVWQRQQRPRIGEIATQWLWVTEEEVLQLLRDRRRGERFGDVLIRRKRINPFRIRALLWYQQKLQRPIGEYFVANGLLSELEIQRFLRQLQAHNLRF